MRRSTTNSRLNVQALDDHVTPTTGTFVEDFSSESNFAMFGFRPPRGQRGRNSHGDSD